MTTRLATVALATALFAGAVPVSTQVLGSNLPPYAMEATNTVNAITFGSPLDTQSYHQPPTQTKSLTWSYSAKAPGQSPFEDASSSGTASVDLLFGSLTAIVKSDATHGKSFLAAGAVAGEIDASWTDTISIEGSQGKGTMEPFTLTLNVGNPKFSSSGSLDSFLTLQVSAVIDDATHSLHGVEFARYLKSSGIGNGNDKGDPGVNTLPLELPVGYSIRLTGRVTIQVATETISAGQQASADGEVKGASICIKPPVGVSMISASGHVWRCSVP